jgi:hypothetical protein
MISLYKILSFNRRDMGEIGKKLSALCATTESLGSGKSEPRVHAVTEETREQSQQWTPDEE